MSTTRLTPLDVVQGRWRPGDLGFYDRVSVTRHLIRQGGGLGKPGETQATIRKRAENLEKIFCAWSRQNPNDFQAYAFVDSETGGEIRQARMHHEMQAAFSADTSTDVTAYRGSGKTTQIVGRILWTLGDDPDKLIKLISEGGETAEQRVREVRNNIESNPRVSRVFPNLIRAPGMPWCDQQITVRRATITRDPSLGGWGYNAAGVGGRCHILVGDDAVPPDAMFSAAIRQENKEKWKNVWAKMLFKSGRIWFVCTPWHELDLGAEVRASGSFAHLHFAVGGPDGCKRCPDRGGRPCSIPFHNPWAAHLWPDTALRGVYDRDGSLSYSRSHMLVPLASEFSLFPEKLFVGLKRLDLRMGLPWRWWHDYGIERVMGVDLDVAAGTGKDYYVIFVLGFDRAGYRYAIDVLRYRTDDYRVQLDKITQAYAKYRPALIYAEATQYQRIFTQILQTTTAMPIRPWLPLGRGKGRRVEGMDKKDLRFGVPGLRIHFERGRFFFPYGDDYSREMTDLTIDELMHFSIDETGKMQGVGAHDDAAMALWMAEAAALKLGADLGGLDAETDLTGLEDAAVPAPEGDAARATLAQPHPLLAPSAGTARLFTMPAAPPSRVKPETYEAIWSRLQGFPAETVRAYLRLAEGMREPPTLVQLVQGQFSPAFAGAVTGLAGQHGQPAVRSVLDDLAQQSRAGVVAGNRDALTLLDEEDLDEILGTAADAADPIGDALDDGPRLPDLPGVGQHLVG